ncbi:MAG: hypothetical protein ACI914_001406 [Candidatus Marivariicella framensis]|jgi:hypothetical protein|tara:strand:+ start:2259 stop:2909 length:651 start_codon:yes stop_codon:yes gene_type:complete
MTTTFNFKAIHNLISLIIILFSLNIFSQSEKSEKVIIVPEEKSPLLLSPKKNMSLNFKLNDLTPNKENNSNINMMDQEEFIDPNEYYTSRMNRKQGEKNKVVDYSQNDLYLGDFKTGDQNINVVFRDHEYPDGDMIQIRVNDKVVMGSILLEESFKGVNIELEEGFNRIDFIALNQGESGPNTAELKVYTHSGKLVGSNRWNLATGVKATYIVVKE